MPSHGMWGSKKDILRRPSQHKKTFVQLQIRRCVRPDLSFIQNWLIFNFGLNSYTVIVSTKGFLWKQQVVLQSGAW